MPAIFPRERVAAWGVACIVVPMLTLAVCGVGLLDRPFWADETLSWIISSDADATRAAGALAGGIDTNAPFIHGFFRAVGSAFGHSPIVYRAASAAFLSLGFVGLYLTLRQTHAVRAAVVGCLAFWALPIVVAHQTETRFYGPLVAATVWTCYFAGRRREGTTLGTTVGLALWATLLCATHYFGVIVLAAIVLAEATRQPWRRSIEQLLPTLCGFCTTACLYPLLHTQRAALADVGGTWLADDFWTNLRTAGWMLVPAVPFVAMVTLTCVAVALAGRREVGRTLRVAARSPLAGLVLFLFAMLAFDRLVQPVLVPRYLMPALPILALATAALAATLRPRVQHLVAAGMLLLVSWTLVDARSKLADPGERTALSIVRSVGHVPDGVPVLVDWRGHLLPIWAARPELRDRLAFLDDPRCTHPDLAQAIPFERQMVQLMRRHYGFPNLASLQDAQSMDRFVLVSEFPEWVDERFAGWSKRTLGPLTFELSRNAAIAQSR